MKDGRKSEENFQLGCYLSYFWIGLNNLLIKNFSMYIISFHLFAVRCMFELLLLSEFIADDKYCPTIYFHVSCSMNIRILHVSINIFARLIFALVYSYNTVEKACLFEELYKVVFLQCRKNRQNLLQCYSRSKFQQQPKLLLKKSFY